MAPRDIEKDTLLIIQCLFDDDEVLDRYGQIETDGPMSDGIDPYLFCSSLFRTTNVKPIAYRWIAKLAVRCFYKIK